ncbi:MAG: hypothetical protein ACXABG_04135, partial [Promethearchaeota archaeon]
IEVFLTMVGGKIEFNKPGIILSIPSPPLDLITGPSEALTIYATILGIYLVIRKNLKKRKVN